MKRRLLKKKVRFALDKHAYCDKLFPKDTKETENFIAYKTTKNYTYKQFKNYMKENKIK